MRWHSGYAAMAAIGLTTEIVIALFVHDAVIRPFGGDALAVASVYCAIRAVVRWRAAIALSIALAVAVFLEVGQLFGLVYALGLGGSAIARTVLGTGFDLRDFAAYALGGVAVVVAERVRPAGAA